MTTLKDKFVTTLPNMTMRSVYMDYYNQLNKIEGNAQRYVPVYRHYDSNRNLEPLVQNYFEQYLGQFQHKFLIRSMKTLSGVLSTNWYRVI